MKLTKHSEYTDNLYYMINVFRMLFVSWAYKHKIIKIIVFSTHILTVLEVSKIFIVKHKPDSLAGYVDELFVNLSCFHLII